MAYTNKNHIKRVQRIIAIYKAYKEADIPDSFILNNVFPKNGIYISYRTWMYYKGLPASALQDEPPPQFRFKN